VPYRSIEELPESVKVLPVEAQRLFLEVVNSALEQYDGNEEKSFATAWIAVKKRWKKEDDRWVRRGSEISFTYLAQVKPFLEDERHYAEIYVIDTTANKARWQVTDEALKNALGSLLGKPLLAYPDHSGTIEVGRFIDVSKPDGYVIGRAEITDEEAWSKIQDDEWKYVSPQVKGFWVTNEDGVDVLYDFGFEHVAFVPNPAYPNARVLNAQMEDGGLRTFSTALTSELDQVRNKKEKKKRGERKKLSEDIAAELRTELAKAQTKIAALESANTELKADLDRVIGERHSERVGELVNLRLKAGLVEADKRREEVDRLSELGDDTLNLLTADTKAFIAHIPKPSGPKARYTAEQQMDAVESVRERLFGYRRDKDGGIIGGV
jgi:cation transport regulator ChaB